MDLEFQSEIISKHKRDQEDNSTRLQNEVDVEIKELNEKLLVIEKHDRKYNLYLHTRYRYLRFDPGIENLI